MQINIMAVLINFAVKLIKLAAMFNCLIVIGIYITTVLINIGVRLI